MDEAIRECKALPCGVRVGESRISVVAFANDVVLVATTIEGLRALVKCFAGCLAQSGLKVNPRKCRSLSLGIDGQRRKWFVDAQAEISIGNDNMVLMGPLNVYKYLGIYVGCDGKRVSYGSTLQDGLENLRRAPLKPQQRLFVLIHHLIPTI